MIVFRVAVQVHKAKISKARALFGALTQASRLVPGVVCFDILSDPHQAGRFVSIGVYEDQAALDRQGALPQLDGQRAENNRAGAHLAGWLRGLS